tara:strand:- start:243 stop:467 length:225 start_codon:yes stop_codon:yes gene_type:complete
MFNERQEKLSNSNRSWIEQLRPIIRDFKDGSKEPLTSQEVERLSLIIRLKIDLEEGNVSIDDLEIARKHGSTHH